MLGDKFISFMLASAIHAASFTAGSVILVRPAQYGIQEGESSIEVNLVAALPRDDEMAPAVESVEPAQAEEPGEVIVPEEPKPAPAEASAAQETGDGNSPVPGKDMTTFYASGGAQTEAKPNYLKNPPPLYPEAARRLGQEGLVVLEVRVSRSGLPDTVEVKQSSGYRLLDETAVKSVRRWKFHPARIGTLPIESVVEVPIRFQLKEE
ncbi:MAG: TonB family protein [Candidatus Omnitrophota bacterium]